MGMGVPSKESGPRLLHDTNKEASTERSRVSHPHKVIVPTNDHWSVGENSKLELKILRGRGRMSIKGEVLISDSNKCRALVQASKLLKNNSVWKLVGCLVQFTASSWKLHGSTVTWRLAWWQSCFKTTNIWIKVKVTKRVENVQRARSNKKVEFKSHKTS